MAGALGEVVRVAEADPELLRGVAGDAAIRLRRSLIAGVIHVDRRDAPPTDLLPPHVFGMLVLDGVLTRRVRLGARASVELLGPSDVLRPWQDGHELATLPALVDWRVVEPVRLAVLDGEFVTACARHPSILAELMARSVQRSDALADRLMIAQIPRLDARLVALLWHLADRWGRREHGRVRIALRLGHETIAALACAQRPSVSVALRNLSLAGRIARRSDGGWDLLGPPADERELRTAAPIAVEPLAVMA